MFDTLVPVKVLERLGVEEGMSYLLYYVSFVNTSNLYVFHDVDGVTVHELFTVEYRENVRDPKQERKSLECMRRKEMYVKETQREEMSEKVGGIGLVEEVHWGTEGNLRVVSGYRCDIVSRVS